MTTEGQFEQLAIQCFQDTGWNYAHGAVIAPEGVVTVREDFRAFVLKGRLVEAVRIFGSRQSFARGVVGYRDINRDIVSRFGGDSGKKWEIATEIPTKCRDFALLAGREAVSRQLSHHPGRFGHKEALPLGRPFRAWNRLGDGNPGRCPGLSCDAPLGRWRASRAINKERRYPIALPMRGYREAVWLGTWNFQGHRRSDIAAPWAECPVGAEELRGG